MANAKYVLAGLLFTSIAFGLGTCAIVTPFEGLMYVFIPSAGFAALLTLFFGVVCFFISTQRIAKHHSTFSALRLFSIKYHRLYVGSRRLREMRGTFKNPRDAQERLLRDIIEQNKDTDYGRRFKLGEIATLDDFRNKHPLCDYDQYENFVKRVSKGEKNVMTTEKVTRLVTTSGTTGKSKLIPQDEYFVDKMFSTIEALQQELFPNFNPLQSMLKVHANGAIRRGEGGVAICPATALEPFMVKNFDMYTPPGAGQLIGSLQEAFYIDLLFALRDKDLGSALILFTPTIVALTQFLEENWRDLVKDIAEGSINADLKLNPEIRDSLQKSLGSGDPQRAKEVEYECEKGSDGIMKRLWPHMEFISTIDIAGLRTSLANSVAKGITIHCSMYPSSEGCPLGINFWPFEEGPAEYVLNPPLLIYEFIKEDDIKQGSIWWGPVFTFGRNAKEILRGTLRDKPNPSTYFIDEVEAGQRYELVLSQRYGIYRFRFGDVIEVSGFYQNCPKVRVLYRKASLLNLVGEKVDQIVVKEAVMSALTKWQGLVSLLNYCVAESIMIPGSTSLYYNFFLELKSATGDKALPEDLTDEVLSQEIERGICERHSFYLNFRATSQITPAKANITLPGAFDELREYILSQSDASRAQFKMPLKLRNKEHAKVMMQHSINKID